MVPAPQEPGQAQHAHQVLREHVGPRSSKHEASCLLDFQTDKVSPVITKWSPFAGGDLHFIYVYLSMGFSFSGRWAPADYPLICSSTGRGGAAILIVCVYFYFFSVSLDVGHKALLVRLPLSGIVQQYQPPLTSLWHLHDGFGRKQISLSPPFVAEHTAGWQGISWSLPVYFAVYFSSFVKGDTQKAVWQVLLSCKRPRRLLRR